MRRNMMATLLIGTIVVSACAPNVLTLDVGTCFDDPGSYVEVADVPVVDCSRPHDNEVFANQDLTGADFPGTDQVINRANAICYGNFSSYIGIAYESSVYEIGTLYPTEESWAAGDREVICFVYDMDMAKITGSVNGIAQ